LFLVDSNVSIGQQSSLPIPDFGSLATVATPATVSPTPALLSPIRHSRLARPRGDASAAGSLPFRHDRQEHLCRALSDTVRFNLINPETSVARAERRWRALMLPL